MLIACCKHMLSVSQRQDPNHVCRLVENSSTWCSAQGSHTGTQRDNNLIIASTLRVIMNRQTKSLHDQKGKAANRVEKQNRTGSGRRYFLLPNVWFWSLLREHEIQAFTHVAFYHRSTWIYGCNYYFTPLTNRKSSWQCWPLREGRKWRKLTKVLA